AGERGVRGEGGKAEIRRKEAALAQALAVAERAQALTDLKAPRLDTLLAMRGVVEAAEPQESEEAEVALNHALLTGLASVLDELVSAREAEGERLQAVISKQLAAIAALVDRAEGAAARQPGAISARLSEQIARLAEASAGLDPERLHQEVLLLAAKADIQEELDRLRAHLAAANELIESSQPVGRKFEFLAQEFNREANTICSKASDIEISRTGIELKTVSDQLREQVQNIECGLKAWGRPTSPERDSCWCCRRPPARARPRLPASCSRKTRTSRYQSPTPRARSAKARETARTTTS